MPMLRQLFNSITIILIYRSIYESNVTKMKIVHVYSGAIIDWPFNSFEFWEKKNNYTSNISDELFLSNHFL